MNVYIINSMRKHIGVIEAVFVVFEVKWHHGYLATTSKHAVMAYSRPTMMIN